MIFVAQRRRFDRKSDLDPAIEIARHPVGARQIEIGLAGVLEIVNPAVLEETADNADDADVFTQPGNFRPQAADAPDDQIDFHARRTMLRKASR